MHAQYTDDSILMGPCLKEIDKIMVQMHKVKLNITEEGTLKDFLVVNIDRRKDGMIHVTQPLLIDSILKDLNLVGSGVKIRDIPACSSRILKRHSDSESYDKYFNYQSVISKMNYLERGSSSDISYAVHQCVSFCSDLKMNTGMPYND